MKTQTLIVVVVYWIRTAMFIYPTCLYCANRPLIYFACFSRITFIKHKDGILLGQSLFEKEKRKKNIFINSYKSYSDSLRR